jgi:chitin synthase
VSWTIPRLNKNRNLADTSFPAALGIKAAVTNTAAPVIPLVLLALILGLPGLLIVITAHRVSYVLWMLIYLLSLPIWNLILPTYAYWHFDDFSWGDTRQTAGEKKGAGKGGHEGDGEFDSSKITMKRWGDFEQERRLRQPREWESASGGPGAYTNSSGAPTAVSSYGGGYSSAGAGGFYAPPAATAAATDGGRKRGHERTPSNLQYEERYADYP